MQRKKQILFTCIMSFLLTNCGGGGGGGSSIIYSPVSNPEQNFNNNGVHKDKISFNNDNKNNKIDPNIISDGNLNIGNSNHKLQNPQVVDSKHQNANANEPNANKEKFIVAILDSDFLSHKDELKKKYPNIQILDKISRNPKPNGSPHGERVLELMAYDTNFNIIAASVGEKDGDKTIISPSLKIYKDVFAKFGDQKVKIINQSWGVDFPGDLKQDIKANKTYRSLLLPLQRVRDDEHLLEENQEEINKRGDELIDFYSAAVDNGGLFIWANGNKDINNNSLFQASLQPSLPIVKSSLEKGWLSVIGVEEKDSVNLADSSEGYYAYKHYADHLAYPGYAARWSISASGEAPKSGEGTIGSSYAAPRVARTAALVANKFDWMTNSQVRETLLTTTDKPELKYDSNGNLLDTNEPRLKAFDITDVQDTRYGWGILNTERALKGPGAFLKSLSKLDSHNYTEFTLYFQANIPAGKESYFENDIFGDMSLRKSGEGRLHLTGNNTFSGTTKIVKGVLDIYKQHSANIDVEKEGTLVLHDGSFIGSFGYDGSIIGANIDNNGKLIVPNKELDGKRGINITIAGDYTVTSSGITEIDFDSSLNILGKASLSESTLKITTDNYSGIPQKKQIIRGNVKNIDVNKIKTQGMRKVTASKTNNGLIVEMSRENAIKYLNSEYASSNNTASNVEKVLQDIDTKVYNKTATSDDLARGIAIVEMSHQQFEDSINKMSGEIYASAQSLTFAQSQNINTTISNHLSSLQNFKNSGYEWQGWMSGTYSDGKISDSGYATGKTKMQIQTFGLDKKFNNSIQLGISMSHSTAKAKFDRYAGESRSEALGISLYGKKYFTNDTYTLARIGGSKFTTKVERELINIHGNSTTGNIKHRDKMISTYIEIGKHFKYLTPYVGYGYDHLIRGEFKEKNAAWGINAARKTYHKNSLYLGVRGEYSINTYKFSSYITHSLNIGNRSLDFEGQFTNTDINQKFKGIAQIKNTTLAGLGITKEIAPNFDINFNVDFKWENNKKADALFSTGIQYRF